MEKKLIYNGLCVYVSDNGLDFYDDTHNKLNVVFNKALGRSTVWSAYGYVWRYT